MDPKYFPVYYYFCYLFVKLVKVFFIIHQKRTTGRILPLFPRRK